MSEQLTQHLLIQYCEERNINCHPYEGNKNIFGTLKPDGYYIDEQHKSLFIFEAKRDIKQWNEAKPQLLNYVNVASEYSESHDLQIVPVFVYGTSSNKFNVIYVEDFNNLDTTITLDSVCKFEPNKSIEPQIESTFNPHEFNNYIYNNFKTISSNERMKLVISTLLTIHTGKELTPPLWQRVLEVEDLYGFKQQFEFISKPPFTTLIDQMFKFLSGIPKNQIMNCLYESFAEISNWSFKGETGKSTRNKVANQDGAIQTPPYAVSFMINQLNINPTDIVCDPCCGTGNFLSSSLSKTNRVIGAEYDETRNIATKHALIISGITTPEIYFGDSLNSNYQPTFDYLLMNPPYDHKKEREFCVKFMNLAKKGGAIIIPRSNFKDRQFQKKLIECAKLEKLYIMNPNLFRDSGINIETAVLIFKKSNKNEKSQSEQEFQTRFTI